jgi:hypothetical protein
MDAYKNTAESSCGRYSLESVVSGGIASFSRRRHNDGTRVAVKMLRESRGDRRLRRFINETRAVAMSIQQQRQIFDISVDGR